jgi:hypothetical protein
MTSKPLELEGTWEEIVANSSELAGRRVRVTVLPDEPTPRPLWEQIVEIGAIVPTTEWAKLPRDLARNFEHYMYGSPKEE